MLARVAALFTAFWFVHAALAAPPAEDFARSWPPRVALSPSGEYIAVLTSIDGQKSALRILSNKNGVLKVAETINVGTSPVLNVMFKAEDMLLITVLKEDVEISMTRKAKGEGRATFDRAVVISMSRNGDNATILLPKASTGVGVHAVLPDDPDHVILDAFDPNGAASNLHKVNIKTGASTLIEQGTAQWTGTTRSQRYIRTVDWTSDASGVTYLRYDQNTNNNSIIVYGRPQGGSWTRLRSYAMVDGQRPVTFLGLASPTTVYAADRAGGDLRAIWEYDLATGKALRQILAAPAGEMEATVVDKYNGQLQGAAYVANGVTRVKYLNKNMAAIQAALDEAMPEFTVRRIADYSRDRSTVLVFAEGPSHPPGFYLLDVRRMQLSFLIGSSGLKPEALGTVETIVYPSSDGRQIVAYLTRPAGGGANPPLIVMPHGGPEAQDMMGYDRWRQFFATRGYAVLQPQFRGSDGFGSAHERAAHGKWGTLVQDDVRAGLAKLVADRVIDPQRVCIFGWSYGGYMAMAGAAFSPDLYKCAVAGAGVFDLNAMLVWVGGNYGTNSDSHAYWLARMGDHATRTAASPSNQAGAVKIPVLLVHGEDDWVVPVEQSEIMHKALKKAGKDVTFLRYAEQPHSFSSAQEADALAKIEAFLAKHLKP